MNAFFNAMYRGSLAFRIRSLEIEFDDATQALFSVTDMELSTAIRARRESHRKELARLRSEYSGCLPVGQVRIWTTC